MILRFRWHRQFHLLIIVKMRLTFIWELNDLLRSIFLTLRVNILLFLYLVRIHDLWLDLLLLSLLRTLNQEHTRLRFLLINFLNYWQISAKDNVTLCQIRIEFRGVAIIFMEVHARRILIIAIIVNVTVLLIPFSLFVHIFLEHVMFLCLQH